MLSGVKQLQFLTADPSLVRQTAEALRNENVDIHEEALWPKVIPMHAS